MKRSYIKRSSPKTSKIRQSANGEDCTIQLPMVCNHNPQTTVWAHSNKSEHGKGMGLKAEDQYGAYACSTCHAVYDGQIKRPDWMSKEFVDESFEEAMEISRGILRKKGLL